MCSIDGLFKNNRAWANQRVKDDPDFFTRLAGQQSPRYLWIGCADSRVPANQIIGLDPGEVFVHRNVANLVVHSDLNCLSALQYAVEVLKVTDVIVCGHYGCGGVTCAYREQRAGLVDNWLCHVRDVRRRCQDRFPAGIDERAGIDLLCALNVVEQVHNVCRTTIVSDAWARGADLAVHGLIYGLDDGLLRDLRLSMGGAGDVETTSSAALAALATTR
jgi:carbonic anhydrase